MHTSPTVHAKVTTLQSYKNICNQTLFHLILKQYAHHFQSIDRTYYCITTSMMDEWTKVPKSISSLFAMLTCDKGRNVPLHYGCLCIWLNEYSYHLTRIYIAPVHRASIYIYISPSISMIYGRCKWRASTSNVATGWTRSCRSNRVFNKKNSNRLTRSKLDVPMIWYVVRIWDPVHKELKIDFTPTFHID